MLENGNVHAVLDDYSKSAVRDKFKKRLISGDVEIARATKNIAYVYKPKVIGFNNLWLNLSQPSFFQRGD